QRGGRRLGPGDAGQRPRGGGRRTLWRGYQHPRLRRRSREAYRDGCAGRLSADPRPPDGRGLWRRASADGGGVSAMNLDHETLVAFSKSFGLFYLIALSFGVAVYAFWPGNKDRFERAAHDILEDEDKPCR